jgi:hypothetical protein
MAIVTAYEVDPDPPNEPVGVVRDDGLHLEINPGSSSLAR